MDHNQEPTAPTLPTDRRALLAGIGGLAAGAFLAGKANAGPLNPPSGPIAPTPGPEPRIPIGPATTPGDAGATFRITQPGSYYLTRNIQGEINKSGIDITASGVHIDLMGFEMAGAFGTNAAIFNSASGLRAVSIVNGSIRNWSVGISLSAAGGRLHGIIARSTAFVGITTGAGFVLTECTAIDNTALGIRARDGSTLHNCIARGNGDWGIFAGSNSVVTDCAITENERGVSISSGTAISGCVVQGNRNIGIFGESDNMIMHNKVFNNRNASGQGQGIGVTGQGNLIDSNNIILQAPGIAALQPNNIIVRNSLRANSPTFSVSPGNLVGPTVTSSNIASSNNPHANYTY